MMSFTHNDWGKRDIINNIIILPKRGADTIYTVIQKKYQNYPSTITIKYSNVPYKSLLNMTPHGAYSIAINLHTMTLTDFSHKNGVK